MKILCFSLVLMALFADTCCRSLTPKNDVPDPPKRVLPSLPSSAIQHPARAHIPARDRVPVPVEMKHKLSVAPHGKLNVKEKITPPAQKKIGPSVLLPVKSNVKAPQHPSAKAPLHVFAKIKSTKPIKSQVRANPIPEYRRPTLSAVKVPANVPTSSKGDGVKHGDSKGGLFVHKPGGNKPTEGNVTTTAPQITTTTVDPWEEYCKEACEAGMAGPECDCAGHPIGRRNAPLLEPGSFVNEAEIQPMLQYHPHAVRPSHSNHYHGKEWVSAKAQ